MRKRLRLIALTIPLILVASNSYAAVKAGSSCSKAGIKSVSAGKTYTCVKSGKKLVWDKGLVIPTARPAPSSSSTVVKTNAEPTLSFIETLRSSRIDGKFPIEQVKFPIPPKLPSSWDDVYENRDGIAYKAWQSISLGNAGNGNSFVTFSLSVGPRTSLVFTEIEKAISRVFNTFESTPQPKSISVVAFNFEDQNWAIEKVKELISGESDFYRNDQERRVANMCSSMSKSCWSATAFSTPSGKAGVLLGIVDKEKLKTFDTSFSSYLRSERGLTVAHEYFHVIQLFTLGKNWYQMMFTPPIWFNEASAVFVENGVMNQDSFDRYMQFRAVDSQLAYPSCGSTDNGCIKVNEEVLTKFLSLSNYANNWSDYPYGMKYEVSSRVIEILVALKGYQSLTDIYKYQAQDHTFEEAFEHVYGIAYSKAIPVMAKIVADEFSNNR